MIVLDVWQIDSFEGGKGSRANYLKDVGKRFADKSDFYVNVSSLTSDSAIKNLQAGKIPDLISYGAGMVGLESYITGEQVYYNWCNGGYCLLSLGSENDFSDVNENNTIINSGTENFADIGAILCGIGGAQKSMPTSAYTKLISGEYKYLFGTQRDIFRLITRGVEFSVQPISVFNDLYQNISITASDNAKREKSEQFIELLLAEGNNIDKIGLFYSGLKLYDNELSCMENLQYEYTIKSPISLNLKQELNLAIKNNDLKKLKNLLK